MGYKMKLELNCSISDADLTRKIYRGRNAVEEGRTLEVKVRATKQDSINKRRSILEKLDNIFNTKAGYKVVQKESLMEG